MSTTMRIRIANKSKKAKSILTEIASFVGSETEKPHYLQAITLSVVEDALDRFTLWAANTGALHPPASPYSLEQQLSSAPEIQNHVFDLLDDLLETLEDIKAITDPTDAFESPEPSDSDDEDEDSRSTDAAEDFDPVKSLLRELSQTLKSLFRVAILVRNATRKDRFQRALQLSTALPSEWDIRHVDHKFPKLRDEDNDERRLVSRLGTAIAKRRQFLGYCKNHKERLAEVKDNLLDTRTVISGVTTLLLTNEIKDKVVDLNEPEDEDDTVSMTSAVTTFETQDALSLPKLKDLQKSGPEFECPLCCTLQTFSSDKAWRIHAYRDLKAYVCTVGNSGECHERLFPDRTAWFQHELFVHRSRFLCALCKAGPFTDKKELRGHISNVHRSNLSDEHFSILADTGRQAPTHFKTSDCPFCYDWDVARQKRTIEIKNSNKMAGYSELSAPDQTVVSPAQFKRHVATHQEQLALFAVSGLGENEASTPNSGSVVSISSQSGDIDGDKDAMARKFVLLNDGDAERAEFEATKEKGNLTGNDIQNLLQAGNYSTSRARSSRDSKQEDGEVSSDTDNGEQREERQQNQQQDQQQEQQQKDQQMGQDICEYSSRSSISTRLPIIDSEMDDMSGGGGRCRGRHYWQCCQCHDGWFSMKLVESCPTCLTYRCWNCEYSAS